MATRQTAIAAVVATVPIRSNIAGSLHAYTRTGQRARAKPSSSVADLGALLVFAPLDLFGETANHSIIFQFHACAAFGTDREFAVAPAFSARMIRAPRRKVT